MPISNAVNNPAFCTNAFERQALPSSAFCVCWIRLSLILLTAGERPFAPGGPREPAVNAVPRTLLIMPTFPALNTEPIILRKSEIKFSKVDEVELESCVR